MPARLSADDPQDAPLAKLSSDTARVRYDDPLARSESPNTKSPKLEPYAWTNGFTEHPPIEGIPASGPSTPPPAIARPAGDLPLRQLTNGTKYVPTNGTFGDIARQRTSDEHSDSSRNTRTSASSKPAHLSTDTQLMSGKSQLSLSLSNNTSALTPVEESSALSAGSGGMLKVPDQPPRTSTSSSPPPPNPPLASPPSIIPPSPAQLPHPLGRRRGSAQLVRRLTRSLASDLHLDELPQDEDAARWAERIKQRRISSRRRRDDDGERVVMGIKLDEGHVNFVTAYNMLTGIRFCVSRTNAKMDRDLTEADFVAEHKFAFDVTGNELTPSSRYDFKFKDYAPWVFRHLRKNFRIDPADYLMSLTDKYILSELGSPGKSGSFFYFSRDYKYIIKTIHHSEAKFLRTVLREYYNHVRANPNTLLSEFYGLHRVKIPYGRKIHFLVMNNLFPPHKDIHRTFDLKGSTVGRELKEEQLAANPRATLKDLNWISRNMHLEFGPVKARAFIEQMQRDVALLRRLKIMDYSLLVGIHDLGRGNRENLRDKTLQIFEPGADRGGLPASASGALEGALGSSTHRASISMQPAGGGNGSIINGGQEVSVSSAPPYQLTHARDSTLSRTPSKVETARNAKELRQLVRDERPVPMDQTGSRLPDSMLEEREGYFYADNGGFAATHGDDSAGDEIYYLGIIDCLTKYGFVKKLEHAIKGLASPDQEKISAVSPEKYSERFVAFMKSQVRTREQAGSMTL